MKTFEVYKIAEYGSRTLVASIQADYYERGQQGAAFFQTRLFGKDREIGWAGFSYGIGCLVANTEFLLSLPGAYQTSVELEPIPPVKRPRKKNSLLDLG